MYRIHASAKWVVPIHGYDVEDVEMASPGRVIVIGVAGGSGSGKSFYCKQLQSMCQTLSWCALLPHDMYYKDKEQVDAECDGDWDCPE